jgi:hypothetical protein
MMIEFGPTLASYQKGHSVISHSEHLILPALQTPTARGSCIVFFWQHSGGRLKWYSNK